jgi:hypothetical protein
MTQTTVQVQEPFTPAEPRREWLLRCQQPEQQDHFAICSVLAEDGRVVVVDTNDLPAITLEGDQIGAFREALRAATAVADADIRTRRTRTE